MTESWSTKLFRWIMNLFPAYRGTGARITLIQSDWKRVRIALPLNWRTRNYVGTIFGGSMYGAVDPLYMLMLIKILGPDYVVWDKAASIRFFKPGKSRLTAEFEVSDEEVRKIKKALETERSIDREYSIDLVDKTGEVHATIGKTIYIRRKQPEQD